MHNPVSVNIEGHLNLGDTPWRWGNACEFEGSQGFVVASEFTFTLEHLDKHGRLVIFSGGKHLRALGGDSSVAFNELGHHTTLGFNPQRKRGDINEQNILTFTLDNPSLECSTHKIGRA